MCARRLVKQKLDNQSFDELEDIILTIKKAQNLSRHTIVRYKTVIKILKTCFINKNAFELTYDDANYFVSYLLNEHVYYLNRFERKKKRVGLSAKSVNTYIKACKSIYNELMEYNHAQYNPFEKIKGIKEQEKKLKTINTEDLRTLINNLDTRYYTELRSYALILLLIDTMTRISETLNIKYEDIDFNNNSICLTQTKSRKLRFVNFSNKTKRALKEYIEANDDFTCEYVFTTVNDTQLNPEAFRKQLRHYIKKFNLKSNFSCHAFRHTGATEFIKNGGDVRVLQVILGHARITTTEIYTHIDTDIIKDQQLKYSAVDSITNAKKYNKPRNKRRR
ncbi:TPA: tyrosine-type recombinase/integrase [Staphylococcus delphini]|nr:tyrosine-type recombinase/integrase [Staphylococcus delphini]HEC2147576.1 tyrosine-type recombinase/integrase [Staphylococcus delphini]HEC2168672.1 tyrosine-type recombinase/integrase [Staphylococcus delphini]HEC2171903.1 tyrosine-type recombinase/integrase [Staphylococcus delphini]HEC2181492.1 tyrosine-type recombinase/integrase [Staphylococcus delphini]